MAASSTLVWEVRSTGAATNSGGFNSAAGGTDYTLQNSPQFSGTDLAVDAVLNTKVTSAGHNFVAADVGNTIRITAGTGWTTGVYEIISCASNAATLDRSPALVGVTGGTWKEGGALSSPADFVALSSSILVAGAICYVKSTATYTFASQLTSSVNGTSGAPISMIGYTTTRGDDGQATIQASAAFANLVNLQGTYWQVFNFILDGNSSNADYCLLAGVGLAFIRNCKALNAKIRGFYLSGDYVTARNCWAEGCGKTNASASAGGFYTLSGYGQFIDGCETHDCYNGINCNGSSPAMIRCLIRNDNSNGVLLQGTSNPLIHGCTIRASAGDGIRLADARSGEAMMVMNTILASNTGYGINSVTTTYTNALAWGTRQRNIAFFSNTAGTRTNVPTGTGDITLTASPFLTATDSSLNTDGGGGQLCLNAGWPGLFPAGISTGWPDLGAVQANTNAGGGSQGVTCMINGHWR